MIKRKKRRTIDTDVKKFWIKQFMFCSNDVYAACENCLIKEHGGISFEEGSNCPLPDYVDWSDLSKEEKDVIRKVYLLIKISGKLPEIMKAVEEK